jgi:hypothetical protein
MWAVGEIELEALTLTANITSATFAIGSFFLGCSVNIMVSYGGVDKLTENAAFMLHRGAPVTLLIAAVFYTAGVFLYVRKGFLWKKIKAESRLITPPQ